MPMDREFLKQMEGYYQDAEPEYRLMEQKIGTLPLPRRARHQEFLGTLARARERFIHKLDYLRRFEALEEHLSHATRVELMRSWLEYRARLSELESVIAEAR